MKIFPLKQTQSTLASLLFCIAVVAGLVACDSEGIDRLDRSINPNYTPGAQFGTPGALLDGPSRYVQLQKLNFETNLPSIVTYVFRAVDQYGNAVTGLQTTDFQVLEDGAPISATETSLEVVPHEELPLSLRTVILIDVSSSISAYELDEVKSAVRSMLVDASGNSRLLPQQKVSLYTFADSVKKLKELSNDTGSLVDAINAIQPATAITPTDLYGAVIAGTEDALDSFDIDSITQTNVIIITDGTDTAGIHSVAMASAAVQGKSVYTLGVGNEISESTLGLLGTRGSFALQNFNQLDSTLSNIYERMIDTANSLYYLHYASPKRAAAGNASSMHQINLSVLNNANSSGTNVLADTFDSTDFTNVTANVRISGPSTLEVRQTAAYTATTQWAPQNTSNYFWSFTEDNSACMYNGLGTDHVTITGVSVGYCTVVVEDQTAGDAKGWHTIQVVNTGVAATLK